MAHLTLTPQEVRRLAIAAQQLEAPRPRADALPSRADVLDTIRRITCLQLDPINVVARTQLLVLFSRLGSYDPADLDALLWEDRSLFEYWAHCASIVTTDDFPIFQVQMNKHQISGWSKSSREWLAANADFRQYILDEIRGRGPLYTQEIEDRAAVGGGDSVWYGSRNTGRMLLLMWLLGDITVTRRDGKDFGLKKQWGLLEHHLPEHIDREPLAMHEAVDRAIDRALMALVPARPRDVKYYFTRHSYPGLKQALERFVAEGKAVRLDVRGNGVEWPGPWHLHTALLPELERIRRGDWRPQTVLLSPFDNLISDRDRTELLFDFLYRIEIYTPAAKRQYGYYVMPVLDGDRLIGRLDPKMDRKAGRLTVNAIHLEPGVVADADTRAAIHGAVERLAGFLGARTVDYPA